MLNKFKLHRRVGKHSSFMHKIGRSAYIDWRLSVLLTLALIIFFSAVGYLTYEKMRNDMLGTGAGVLKNRAPIFDEKVLSSLLIDIESRNLERSYLKRGYTGPGDPGQ